MNIFQWIVLICGGLLTITNFALLWSRPLKAYREGNKQLVEGQKCILRSEMLSMYYRHLEEKSLRQHERENFDLLYKAYKALGGNSFIEDVYGEVRDWLVKS